MQTIDPVSLSYMYRLELLVCRPVARDGKPHPSYSTTKSGIAKYVSLLFHILSCEWSWRLLVLSSKGESPDEPVQAHMPIILKGPRESKFNLASKQ